MKLIDIDAFLNDFLTAGVGLTICQYSECDVASMLRTYPAADAVAVVRCKTCKRHRVTEYGKEYCSAPFGYIGCLPVGPDEYCSYGEARQDGSYRTETMLEKFKQMFPNAPVNEEDGTPQLCPHELGWESAGTVCPMEDQPEGSVKGCADCWNRPYHAQKDEERTEG